MYTGSRQFLLWKRGWHGVGPQAPHMNQDLQREDPLHVDHLVSSGETVSDNIQMAWYVVRCQLHLKLICPVEERNHLSVGGSGLGATLVLDLAHNCIVLSVITTTILLVTCCWKCWRVRQTTRSSRLLMWSILCSLLHIPEVWSISRCVAHPSVEALVKSLMRLAPASGGRPTVRGKAAQLLGGASGAALGMVGAVPSQLGVGVAVAGAAGSGRWNG